MSQPGKPLNVGVDAVEVHRLFVREPGWRVMLKHGSEREFCYLIAPGENHYHRLADGEIYLVRGDERICLPCAGRTGLLHVAPRALRPAMAGSALAASGSEQEPGYEVGPPRA